MDGSSSTANQQKTNEKWLMVHLKYKKITVRRN